MKLRKFLSVFLILVLTLALAAPGMRNISQYADSVGGGKIDDYSKRAIPIRRRFAKSHSKKMSILLLKERKKDLGISIYILNIVTE